MSDRFDVIIAGGGLAGLTLGLQLKKQKPEISICIAEKSGGERQMAGHKVGESTVELGTYYLREVIGLGDYLSENQLPKHGLRFFLTPSKRQKIEDRYEMGPVNPPPVPSHQLDRGVLENKLIELNKAAGNVVLLGYKITSATVEPDNHQVELSSNEKTVQYTCKWLVDATGRGSFLKRKLKLEKTLDHDINSVWFRLKGEINVDDWSQQADWINKVPNGLRRLSTTHLMGQGYWVWLIPLVSGYTSVGIVADPKFHDFKEFNRFELAFEWLKKNEPQCAEKLESYKDGLLDFKVLKHYAHDAVQFFSDDKWCLTGEAGPFLDPFYSPGTDFIALANSWITDLICKDLEGKDIYVETIVYEKIFHAVFDNWAHVYRDKYTIFGSTKTMLTKIVWDWANYWSVHTLIFMNGGYTNMTVLKALFMGDNNLGTRLAQLNANIQKLFLNWTKLHDVEIEAKYLDPFEINFLMDLHVHLKDKLEPAALIKRVEENVERLESIGAEMIRQAKKDIGELDDLQGVNPYLDNVGEIAHTDNELFLNRIVEKNNEIASDLKKIWTVEVEM